MWKNYRSHRQLTSLLNPAVTLLFQKKVNVSMTACKAPTQEQSIQTSQLGWRKANDILLLATQLLTVGISWGKGSLFFFLIVLFSGVSSWEASHVPEDGTTAIFVQAALSLLCKFLNRAHKVGNKKCSMG